MRYHDNDQDDIILNYILAPPPSRVEAELEEKHLREQEQLMKEVQAMKDVAQEEMERQKDEYEKKLVELETQMVRVWRVRGCGGWRVEEKRGGEGMHMSRTHLQKFLVYSSSFLSPHPAPSPLLLLSSDLFPSPPLLQQEQTLEVSVHQRTKEEVESRMEELQQRNEMLEEETMLQKRIIHREELRREKVPLTLLPSFCPPILLCLPPLSYPASSSSPSSSSHLPPSLGIC